MNTRSAVLALVCVLGNVFGCSGADPEGEGAKEEGSTEQAPSREPDKFGSCPTVENGVCNHPVTGDGACPATTDWWDCNECPWAGDGYCDEPEKWNWCPEGTDPIDCGGSTPPPSSGSGGGGVYLCYAQGVYETCSDSSGFCSDKTAQGAGTGATESEAGLAAQQDCTTHMLNMVIIGNYPGGSASIKYDCAVTQCELTQ